MPKNVFFVTRNLSGGGAERVISNLANYFSVMGYKVTLVSLDQEEIKYNLAPEVTIKSLVKRNHKENIFTRVYYALLTFIRLTQTIKKEQPICCISFMTSVNIWTGVCCRLLNKSYILSERTSPNYSLEKLNMVTKWITYKIYSKAKFVVLPSKKMLNTYYSLKYFKELKNLVTIYNPVNVFKIPSASTVHPKEFILSIGRLNYDKGFDLLIDAFYFLKDYDIDLVISGVGPYKQVLENKAHELGLSSRVQFVGFKKNLQDYYSQAIMYVSATRVEGYPNTLVEAMSLGCPAISTDCDFGPSEIIENGLNGLLVKVDDRNGLANAMKLLIKDKELREEFSKNALKINETNSIKNIAEEWNNLILT